MKTEPRLPPIPTHVVADALLTAGLTADDVNRSRVPQPIQGRYHRLCALLHERGYSTTQIGRALGGRDHSTIMHAIRMHRKRMKR